MKFILANILQKETWVYLAFGLNVLLAGVVMTGWMAGISSLVQIDHLSVPMQFNTALSLFGISIAGIALYKQYYRLTMMISIVTLVLALLSGAQYVFGVDLAIDEVFITHKITTHSSSPGRMAPNTALCFVLSSICLLWLSVKSTRSSGITIIAGTISLILVLSMLSILGYVFSIPTSYGWGQMTYMSLQTAIGFLCFTIGFLLQIAYHRQTKNASVYYLPVVLGTILLMITLLFTNDLNNKNNRTEDPFLRIKQALVNDHIGLTWNNELLHLATNAQSIIQAGESLDLASSLADTYRAVYLIDATKRLSLVYMHPKLAGVTVAPTDYHYYPAPNNTTATALGVENTGLFLIDGKQHLLLKMPIDSAMFTTNQTAAAIIVLVDIEQFLFETLSSTLSHQDQIHFAQNDATSPIFLPFYTNDNQISIDYADSKFRQSQSRITYLVFCFGLFITLALVVITFFGQRSIYQSKRLLKQAQDKASQENELRRSNLTLTLASEVAKLGIWRWNVETDELTWNQRMYELYNTPEEVIQSGLLFDYWVQSVHKDDRDRAANSLKEAVQQNKSWEEEFKLELTGGVIKHIKATAICYKDHNSQSTLVIGGNMDITKERQLRHQLEAKTKQAENDSLAKSQFLANMSHELRTPMNGILGIGELLNDTALNFKQQQYLQTMLISAEKLLALLNDILDLSKIEAGEMQLEMICVPFEEVVAESLKALATSAHEKGLDYHYHKQNNVPEWVYTDPTRLGQIITNIVSNAIKFTEKGDVRINISIEKNQPSKHDAIMVTFKVCDTGIGLSADEAKTIFAPFSQADQSITRRYGGTGLGLSIVQQLIDLLEGSIEIESELGKGTCVRFSLPMQIGHAEQGRAHSNADYDYYQQHAPGALGTTNCLVIDGNDINRKWLNDMLHSWQCNVTLCADADEGLLVWEKSLNSKQLFDALIIDRNLTGMEAFEFIRKIQQQSIEKKVKNPATIFMMTTKNLQIDLVTCAELNINQHLIKPIKQSEVFNALMAALGKKQAAEDTATIIAKVDEKESLNVLVAEDHPVNQMLVKEILENRGHKISLVENGRLALEALESEHYDAIIMDVQMPVMDGITATKLIRQGSHQADICIIGLTAKALKGDKSICLEAGMDFYMTKPIKPKKLLEILENEQLRVSKQVSFDIAGLIHTQPTFEFSHYQILNRERSLLTTGNDVSLLMKILHLTSESIGPSLVQIKALHHQQDWPMLGRAMHKCKGMLANFCDTEFTDLMDQLIDHAEQANVDAIEPLITDIIQKIEKFNLELTDFMNKLNKE